MKRTAFNSHRQVVALVLLIALFALSACSPASTEGAAGDIPRTEEEVPLITVKELLKEMESRDDILVIDVRTEDEYISGHIKGAVFVPNNRMNAMIPPEGKALVLYCD